MKEFCVRASVEEGCVKDMACGRDVTCALSCSVQCVCVSV